MADSAGAQPDLPSRVQAQASQAQPGSVTCICKAASIGSPPHKANSCTRAPAFRHSFRRLWAQDKFSYSLRVFIALSGALLLCWSQGWMHALIPLFLGVIASALAETDDSWQGRLVALLVTLGCFSVTALGVELLFPYPWLFAVGLAVSSFALTMLGALGERYGTVASATLILSIYSMIGVDQRDRASVQLWREPLLLV